MITAHGQSKHDEELTAGLDKLIPQRLEQIAPGCVVIIAKGSKVIYKKAFGLANVEQKVSMNPEMIFRIGSITKQYTAVAILQLIEQGKIGLQDSVQKYVPGFPSKGYTITIENLLTNTSGIRNYFEISNPSKERSSYTPEQGVGYFRDEPLEFKPGSRFKYSNSNFYLLGYIIEKVTGMSYEAYLQQHVFNTAALKHTYYSHPEKIIPNRASGYSRFNNILENATLEEISNIYAAGGIEANADDLLKWHEALYSSKLLGKETLFKAFSPYKLSDGTASEYGYGCFIKDLDGAKTIEHSGSTDGFQSDVIYIPEQDVFIATLFNCYEQDMEWIMLSNDIARLAIGKPLIGSIELSPERLQQYVGVYQFTSEHQMIVTMEEGKLFVKASNPNARLPLVRLYAKNDSDFFIKEAPLRFEFIKEANGKPFKLITYNTRGKDAEWMKIK